VHTGNAAICSDSDMADRLSTVRNFRFCMYGGKGHCSMEIFAGKNDCACYPLRPFASLLLVIFEFVNKSNLISSMLAS